MSSTSKATVCPHCAAVLFYEIEDGKADKRKELNATCVECGGRMYFFVESRRRYVYDNYIIKTHK